MNILFLRLVVSLAIFLFRHGNAKQRADPGLGMAFCDQQRYRVILSKTFIAFLLKPGKELAVTLLDREIISIDKHDEQSLGLFLALPASAKFFRKLVQNPTNVPTLLHPACNKCTEKALKTLAATLFHVGSRETLVRFILTEENYLRRAITHGPTPAQPAPLGKVPFAPGR